MASAQPELLRRMTGYFTLYKFLRGQSMRELEIRVGLRPGRLTSKGALVYRFLRSHLLRSSTSAASPSGQNELKRGRIEVTFDRDFPAVIRGCAEAPRDGDSTWITEEFIRAYIRLHEAGHAHSVEAWMDGSLVGGLYGVAVGGLFAGESMFHRVSNASKICVARLVERLNERGFKLFDTQMVTQATLSLGASEVRRPEYLRRLRVAAEIECRRLS